MENNILSKLTKEEKQLVKVKTFKKNDVLHHEGDKCEDISIVISGQIKIVSVSFEDTELLYNTIRKGEIFGNNLLFSDSPFYKGDVLCSQESVIVTISKVNLVNILQSNKDFLNAYLNIQSNFSKKLNSTIKLLSYQSAEERFKFFMFQNKNKINYKSVTDLANILSLKRETLSRLLNKLEKENTIKRSLHQITLTN